MLQKLNKKYINKLLNTNSLLMVELNNCHGECMPGYIKYFKDLGFDIDVLINEKQKTENPLYMFDDIDITYLPEYKIIQYLNSNQIDNYEICLFNSNIIYNQKSKSVFDLIKIPHPQTKMLCVEHRLENIKKLSKNAIPIILKKFSENKKTFEVNPHYFGKIKHHNKNKTTNFIVVGNIEGKRKNYNLLTSSVQKLHKNNIKNFKITIVGAGKVSDIPSEIRHYFDIKGRLSYPDMYQEVQNSDYFLTLLDPENPEHDRYIKIGTSGSFQLIYGFNIPCLIEEKFAKIHCFDSANALTYKNNSDLFETMKLAINQSNDEYQNMKGHLSKTSDLIYQNSLKNLGLALNTKQPNQISNYYKKLLNLYIKSYLLFPVYLIKTARMQKKIHKKVCQIIRGQLSHQLENTLLLTKPQIRDFALKNSPTPDYTKKHIKKITNDIYDKFHFRKKHRIFGIKFYTKNKHKELSSLLTYSIKQNELIKKENTILKSQIEETKKELQKNKNDILTQLAEFKNKNQRNYQELNYADLLHDSIHQSNWLKDKTFSLFGWAANYSFIYLLFRTLDQVCPSNILEFGLGQTTKLTSQYIVNKNPSAQLNICEHNQDWINIYKKELAKSENIKINHLDLEFFEYDNKQNDKYKNIIQVTKNQKFDLIIVDGPVGGGKNLPRSNIHDLIKNDNLANDFIIIFDDAERKGEQETIRVTKDLLTEKNIQFSTFSRNGIKNQFIITSPSREFLKFL